MNTNAGRHERWRLRRYDSLPLREVIPFWFAVSSPLIGLVLGFLGAWFVTWLVTRERSQQNRYRTNMNKITEADFLPRDRGADSAPASPATSSAGKQRRVLIVDNDAN